MTSLCAVHGTPAAAACTRCGRFACEACLGAEGLCTQCLARPEVRLRPSPEARRALWMALLGFHGVVVLLPVAAWLARAELEAIARGTAPLAGKPWAQGALALALGGVIAWFIGLVAWLG